MENLKIGDQFSYISTIADHSFDFMIFGINKSNVDIIIDRDTNYPSLYKLKKEELKKCIKRNKQ